MLPLCPNRTASNGELSIGSRVVSVTVNGQPLDENRKYTLAPTNFLAVDGGGGYEMLKEPRLLIAPEQAQSDYEILRRAIATAKSIAPKIAGRIKRLDSGPRHEPDCVENK